MNFSFEANMLLGGCLRLSWFWLFFCLGSCFPTDHGAFNTTSLSSESSAISDPVFAASSAGNESATSIDTPDETTDSNSPSNSDILSPRAFYVSPPLHAGEKLAGLMQPPLASSAGGLYPISIPWFVPFHEAVYPGTQLYTYGDGSRGFPYYDYGGAHVVSVPYGYSYGIAGSPHYNYAYGTGGSPSPGYSYGMGDSSLKAYDRKISVSPPYGVGPPPAYGYLPQQPLILDPELVLIGNILMKVREMPLAQTWMTSEVPAGMTKFPVYPSSLIMQSNRDYHRAGDLLSDNQYFNNEDSLESEHETLATQQQDVPETDS